jgi:hypothetical protein
MHQHLRHGLDNFNIALFQSADDLPMHLSSLDLGIGNDCWIEYHSYIFETLYCMDILRCTRFFLAHFPFQEYLNFELLSFADSGSSRIYSEMIMGAWWWDMQDQFPAEAKIMILIRASDMINLSNLSDDQHALSLYVTICNV